MNKPLAAAQKDNLTDVVGAIPPNTPAPTPATTPQPSAPQQVVASNGQTVTLGQNPLRQQ